MKRSAKTERAQRRRKAAGQCGRKARHLTREIADAALYLLQVNGKARGDQRVYACDNCSAFHIGKR
tara:strand:- start:117 stop:314 length:198 start_codon:yes stop_codon:yes gene_type:complete